MQYNLHLKINILKGIGRNDRTKTEMPNYFIKEENNFIKEDNNFIKEDNNIKTNENFNILCNY